MKFIDDFKAFAMKGNLIDMAVGIIIGAAFGKIISSFVGDVIMPPLGLLIGGVNFTDLKIVLKAAVDATHPAVTLNYGNFLQVTFDFLIVALTIFIVLKAILAAKKKEEAAPAPPAPPVPTKEEILLTEIRDLLKK
jgi:large conductance mechanosensitive channel